jgi:undecaprenyl diphosphate synthase
MSRIPAHIGIIPDGNRRWAVSKGLNKEESYQAGLAPGLKLFKLCQEAGIEELTFYGFTQDNTNRPKEQTRAFQRACIDAVNIISGEDADLLIVGNTDSPLFPRELLPYTTRTTFGSGGIRLNFLVNYGWQWDLGYALNGGSMSEDPSFSKKIFSSEISRVDLIIRWGGRRRLSGFLPVQSVYSDFYIIDALWPNFKDEDFYDALEWYQTQDVTLGG